MLWIQLQTSKLRRNFRLALGEWLLALAAGEDSAAEAVKAVYPSIVFVQWYPFVKNML